MLTSILGGVAAGGPGSRKGSIDPSAAQSAAQQQQPPPTPQALQPGQPGPVPPLPPKDSGRIRFAGFLAVEVRGRQVLIKAPVWTLG